MRAPSVVSVAWLGGLAVATACDPQASSPAPDASRAAAVASAAPGPPRSAPASASSAPRSPPPAPTRYPPLDGEGEPLAVALCTALHETPAVRRSICCDARPERGSTADCVRALSGAMRAGEVSVRSGAVDACVQAIERTYDGCDWVGPTPPHVTECEGVVVGAKKRRDSCRSSLDCPSGAWCAGLDAGARGTCAPASATGVRCGSLDELAEVTGHSLESHPHCEGICEDHACRAPRGAGDACKGSSECDSALVCRDGTCQAGARPRAEGDPCSAEDCPPSLRCIDGACSPPRAAGETCSRDVECVAACLSGVCGRRCRAGMRLRR